MNTFRASEVVITALQCDNVGRPQSAGDGELDCSHAAQHRAGPGVLAAGLKPQTADTEYLY